jgi:cytidylate kinase
LECSEEERYLRVQNRENKPYEEIKMKNEKRESDLILRYKEVYPDIIFPPSRDKFDMVIDTQDISPEEIVSIILQKIES